MSIAELLKSSLEKHSTKSPRREPKKSHKVDEMRIRHADSGGHIIEHHKEKNERGYPHMEKVAEHVSNGGCVCAHVHEHMCTGGPDTESDGQESRTGKVVGSARKE